MSLVSTYVRVRVAKESVVSSRQHVPGIYKLIGFGREFEGLSPQLEGLNLPKLYEFI